MAHSLMLLLLGVLAARWQLVSGQVEEGKGRLNPVECGLHFWNFRVLLLNQRLQCSDLQILKSAVVTSSESSYEQIVVIQTTYCLG